MPLLILNLTIISKVFIVKKCLIILFLDYREQIYNHLWEDNLN